MRNTALVDCQRGEPRCGEIIQMASPPLKNLTTPTLGTPALGDIPSGKNSVFPVSRISFKPALEKRKHNQVCAHCITIVNPSTSLYIDIYYFCHFADQISPVHNTKHSLIFRILTLKKPVFAMMVLLSLC